MPEFVDLPGLDGYVHCAGPFGIAVDCVAVDGVQKVVEVLVAEPQEGVQLIGPVGEPVAEAVGEGCLAEPAVAAAGAEGGRLGLEHDDPAAGVCLGGEESGPEAGKAGSHDHKVGTLGAMELICRVGGVGSVQPEHGLAGVGQRRFGRGGWVEVPVLQCIPLDNGISWSMVCHRLDPSRTYHMMC